jgi:hypothetical protein
MIQRIPNSKNFVASLLAAATGMTLYFRVSFPDDNIFLQVMALRSPSIFCFVKYPNTLLLFSTPYVGYSIALSGVYIFTLKAGRRVRASRLPLFPDLRKWDELFLVLWGIHNPRKQVPAENPQWLVIPERGLFTGVAILGTIGPEFQAWLRYKNANGAEIYVSMNTLKLDASNRTKNDIGAIRHLYLDLDHGGATALEAIENSDLVPLPNYVLAASPEKFQVVWKAEGITLEEAEALQHAMVGGLGGNPAATDSTRVLRLPGFANKKYDQDFYVQARTDSTHTYRLRDFKIPIDSQDAPRHHNEEEARIQSAAGKSLSQSEHDWAYAKRALARGDDSDEVIRRLPISGAMKNTRTMPSIPSRKRKWNFNETTLRTSINPGRRETSEPIRGFCLQRSYEQREPR